MMRLFFAAVLVLIPIGCSPRSETGPVATPSGNQDAQETPVEPDRKPAPPQPNEAVDQAEQPSDDVGNDEDEPDAAASAPHVEGELMVMLTGAGELFANIDVKALSGFHKRVDALVEEVFADCADDCRLHVDYSLHRDRAPTAVIRHDGRAPKELCLDLLKRIEGLTGVHTKRDSITARGVYRVGSPSDLNVNAQVQALPSIGAASSDAQGDLASLKEYAKQVNDAAAAPAQHDYTDLDTPAAELKAARRHGWRVARRIAQRLETADASATASKAWLTEFSQVAEAVEASPMLDLAQLNVAQLTTNNANFWRTHFEVEPGDQALVLLHAALLLAGGEGKRALYMTRIGTNVPRVEAELQTEFQSIIDAVARLMSAFDKPHKLGIQQFDDGKLEEAATTFAETLKVWPQDALAAYELGLTRLRQARIAAGQPPLAPGQIITSGDPVIPDETVEMNRKARFHDPYMLHAYQGKRQGVGATIMMLHRVALPAMQQLVDAKGKAVSQRTMMTVAATMDRCEVADICLVGVAAVVGRRKPEPSYQEQDHSLVERNLQRLVGEEVAKEIIETTKQHPKGMISLAKADSAAADE